MIKPIVPTTGKAKERNQRPLILRLKRLAAQKGQPLNIRGGQQLQKVLFRLCGKGLPVAEIPCLGLEAVFAVVGAAGDEQRHPHADTVGNITFLQFSVMHGTTS